MTDRPFTLTPAHHALLDWLVELALSPEAKESKPCAPSPMPVSQPTAAEYLAVPTEDGGYKRRLRIRIR